METPGKDDRFDEIRESALFSGLADDEIAEDDLRNAGVTDDSVVRINEQGDIELRRADGWDVIGGLLGDFRARILHETGMDWA